MTSVFLSAVPTVRIRNIETQQHGPKSLDRKQWHRLLRTVEQAKGVQNVRNHCVVLLLYHTGLRLRPVSSSMRLTA